MKNRWILYSCYLWGILFLGIPFLAFSQTLYLPHYTTKNGLPSNNCYYTLQDKRGYIWVGTDAGVSRFDGTTFENFSVDDGLPDNQILQLREDKKGRIWFLALNGQLSYFYNGRIYNAKNDPKLKALNFDAVIVSFLEDSRGRFWFGTNKNIIGMWDGKQVLKFVSGNPQKQLINAYLYEDQNGQIWSNSSHALHLFNNKEFVLIREEVVPYSYKTVVPAKQSIYLLHKDGLYYRAGIFQQKILSVPPAILENNPGYIHVSNDALWLANGNGVYMYAFEGKTEHILQGVEVSQVIEDVHQNRWFTTKNGIYRLPPQLERLYTLSEENGLSKTAIKSILKDDRQQLWLGMTEGKLDVLNQGKSVIKRIQLSDKKKFSEIKQLSFDEKRRSIYFSSEYGLGRFSHLEKNQPDLQYLRESHNSMFVVKNFSIDQDRQLAVALSSGVVIVNDRNGLFEFTTMIDREDYFKERSYRVFYDRRGTLWFSSLNGVAEFNGHELFRYNRLNQLFTSRINDMQQLPSGVMAMATDGYGILFVKDRKLLHHLTMKDGLNNNTIKRLFVRGEYIWTISNSGINRILLKNGKIAVHSFDYTNDVLSDDLNDLYIDRDTAYFATNNGLVYFVHSHTTQSTPSAKVYISAMSHQKTPLDLSYSRFVFKPGDHNLIFNYSAIDFKNQRIIYRYRLKPDAPWTETISKRLEISTLEPGKYVFEVAAKSQDNQWSAPAKIHFELQKYFWQTWWFISLLILISATLLYLITVRITRKQKNKEQEKLLLKHKVLMLEQQALQVMMNPHFVFNVMNSIQHYINTNNTSSANKVLTGFARLIRKNLEICTQSYIGLDEEIAYLNLYLSLEKYRFGEKLRYAIEIDSSIDKEETFIPSMLLQPFIENAIWHGIMPKEEGGSVHIRIVPEGEDYLKISIIDDGIGIDNSLKQKQQGHQSKGMTLTRERVQLLNKIEANPIHLSVEQCGLSGTMISIRIPLRS